MDAQFMIAVAHNTMKIVKLTQNSDKITKDYVDMLCDAYYYEGSTERVLKCVKDLWTRIASCKAKYTGTVYEELCDCVQKIQVVAIGEE